MQYLQKPRSIAVVAILFAFNCVLKSTVARVACTTSEFCEAQLLKGSRCIDGYCDNPYQYGCLRSKLDSFEKLRACHSEDPPGAAEAGLCRDPTEDMLEYPEVRITSQNWESPFFAAWILQILLSELLDVPTTIETGVPDVNVNFYDPEARFEYGLAFDEDGLERAARVHDCRNVEQVEGEPYKSCGHAVLEIWTGQNDAIERLREKKVVEAKSFIGMVGEEGWHVPLFTAEKDPSLMSWLGMTGKENRRKLADRFLRPTKWGDYCDEVSTDGCTSGNDTVAIRAPRNETERNSYFIQDLYVGHFRKTEQNDCDKWPQNCTGHFLDYPCGWSSFFIGQVYHLNIGLESNGDEPGANGYSYAHMVEIWQAANWTKSDVIGWWWRPESLYLDFEGTDFELQRISLPPTNHECAENRMNIRERCGPDNALRVGNRDGSCDVAPIPNYKLLSTGLYSLIFDDDIPEPMRSPAYEVLTQFSIDGFDLGKIFAYWRDGKIDKYGFDSRDAVCQWVSENLEELRRSIPRTYPRRVEETPERNLTWIGIGLGCLAFLCTMVCTGITYRQRERKVFQFAQVEFVFLLLVGILCVSMSAILVALPPTDSSCLAAVWLLNVGYCLELVPLVVKIAAINQLMQAAKKMKRIKLNRSFLFLIVAALMAVIVMYLVFWSIFDPPSKQGVYSMDGLLADNQDTVVSVLYFCESSSIGWTIFSVGAQGFLLLCASILAFLTRKMTHDVNEAATISILIYWNFVCVLLRIVLLMLQDSIDAAVLRLSLSLILSADSLATILIYFIPKFIKEEKKHSSNVSVFSINVGFPNFMSDISRNSGTIPPTFSPQPVPRSTRTSKVSFVEQPRSGGMPSITLDEDQSTSTDSQKESYVGVSHANQSETGKREKTPNNKNLKPVPILRNNLGKRVDDDSNDAKIELTEESSDAFITNT